MPGGRRNDGKKSLKKKKKTDDQSVGTCHDKKSWSWRGPRVILKGQSRCSQASEKGSPMRRLAGQERSDIWGLGEKKRRANNETELKDGWKTGEKWWPH